MKTYILDTNVLVHDYHSFNKILRGNKIVIPFVVLEELDKLKTKNDQVGVNARNVIRNIEKELVGNNPYVIVVPCNNDISVPDDRILDVCLGNKDSILISKDVCMRTKARALGINVEDYKDDKVKIDDLYNGMCELFVNTEMISEVYDKKIIKTNDNYYPNQAVILIDETNVKNKAITIYKDGELQLIDNKVSPFGLACANLEQQIATNMLLDPSISLVTMTGLAGSGKTLIAVANALEAVLERSEYKKIMIARPIMPFQKDIGYLPGDVKEKIINWFGPIMDNLEFLFSFSDDQPISKKGAKLSPFEELEEKGLIEMLPMTFVRGRSIPNQYIIIDECLEENQLLHTTNGIVKVKDVAQLMQNEDVYVLSKNLITHEIEYKQLESMKIEDFNDTNEKMYEIELENGDNIIVTGNHKLYINGKYQRVADVLGKEDLYLDGLYD